MFKKLIVHLVRLDNESKKMSLEFNIRSTDVAQKWALQLSQDLPNGLRENNKFVGFYKDLQLEIYKVEKEIIILVDRLRELYPETDFGVVNSFEKLDNEALNQFHRNFVDAHLLKENLTNNELILLNDLNNKLHELEFLRLMKWDSRQIPQACIYVTFHQGKLGCLTDKDYEDSVVHQRFGTIYINYSQVGRHILDIYLAQDNNIHLDHIQLWNKFSSDFFIYLGLKFTVRESEIFLERMEKWYNKHMFPRLEIPWDLKKLCIGYIPVADIENYITENLEIKLYQKRISEFQRIHSVEII